MRQKIIRFQQFRAKHQYEILLLSFILLLFGDIFFGPNIDPMPFLIFQNVLASTFIFYNKKRWKIPLVIFLSFLVSLELIDFIWGYEKSRLIFSSTYIIYFLFLSVQVYHQILTIKEVDAGMVAAVLCGFIILGMIGGSVFTIIEVIHPGSFNNLAEGIGGITDLIYFSFITILTIGYGDITPASDVAQKMAMFIGLIGYFYGVVVIGIIIGKYLAKKK